MPEPDPPDEVYQAWSLVAQWQPAPAGSTTGSRPATPLAAAARVLPPPAVPTPPAPPPIPPMPTVGTRPAQPLPRRKRGRWVRRLALVSTATALTLGASVCYLDRSLHRVDALADYPNRVGQTAGTNWLLAGTDTEHGAPRADTLILVHIPRRGQASIVSIPRESTLPIPGHGRGPITLAFAVGGRQLLVAAIEGATGLRIDHFAQIGFGDFDSLVDDVGGVGMCLPQPMNDPLAGIRLTAGCATLSGSQALGFVRSRATPPGELARRDNQRRFLCALLDRITTPGTYRDPARLWTMARGGVDTVTVARGDHLWDLLRLGLALRDNPVTADVPTDGTATVQTHGTADVHTDGTADVHTDGTADVDWDSAKADRIFRALAVDRAVPADLITTQ